MYLSNEKCKWGLLKQTFIQSDLMLLNCFSFVFEVQFSLFFLSFTLLICTFGAGLLSRYQLSVMEMTTAKTEKEKKQKKKKKKKKKKKVLQYEQHNYIKLHK